MIRFTSRMLLFFFTTTLVWYHLMNWWKSKPRFERWWSICRSRWNAMMVFDWRRRWKSGFRWLWLLLLFLLIAMAIHVAKEELQWTWIEVTVAMNVVRRIAIEFVRCDDNGRSRRRIMGRHIKLTIGAHLCTWTIVTKRKLEQRGWVGIECTIAAISNEIKWNSLFSLSLSLSLSPILCNQFLLDFDCFPNSIRLTWILGWWLCCNCVVIGCCDWLFVVL